MSGTRVPVLCRPATRKEVREYVVRARTYARAEFERGHDEAAVLRRLRRATPGISMTYQVEEEYLHFLGVSSAAIAASRVISGLLAVVIYVVVSTRFQGQQTAFGAVVALFVAIACGLALQKLMRAWWKRMKR